MQKRVGNVLRTEYLQARAGSSPLTRADPNGDPMSGTESYCRICLRPFRSTKSLVCPEHGGEGSMVGGNQAAKGPKRRKQNGKRKKRRRPAGS